MLVDIRDLNKRFVSYTNSIDLPLTENNEEIFGNPKEVNAASLVPYRKYTTRVLFDGIEYFTGTISISQVINLIRASIFESSINVWDSIQGKKLYELDIANSAWTASDIDSARLATSGAFAPVLNWGDYDISTNEIGQYLPSYFYGELVQKILENTGYTFSGDVLTSADFEDLIIPFIFYNF